MVKYNDDYSTKLIEASHVDKIYDFESYHALNLIYSPIFQRKILANRLAMVGMAGGQRPQLGQSFG